MKEKYREREIYIYRERNAEREREKYIYIYIEREREEPWKEKQLGMSNHNRKTTCGYSLLPNQSAIGHCYRISETSVMECDQNEPVQDFTNCRQQLIEKYLLEKFNFKR